MEREQPLGLFLEDIYGEWGDHGEPAEAGEMVAVPQNCGEDVISHEPAGCAVQAANQAMAMGNQPLRSRW